MRPDHINRNITRAQRSGRLGLLKNNKNNEMMEE